MMPLKLVSNLSQPSAIDFGSMAGLKPQQIIFFIERDTFLLKWLSGDTDYNLVSATYVHNTVTTHGDGGLIGLALDPLFAVTGHVYLTQTISATLNQVTRWTFDLTTHLLRDPVSIIQYSAGQFSNGGCLKFGPDKCLYVATGNIGNDARSQSLGIKISTRDPSDLPKINSLSGKILRINPDGSVPSDNPFPANYIYASGFRNPTGLCWQGNTMYAVDQGSMGQDKIVKVISGGDYGFPYAIPGAIAPLRSSGLSETWQPNGICAHNNTLYVANGGGIPGMIFGDPSIMQFDITAGQLRTPKRDAYNLGSIRDCAIGMDGNLYFVTTDALYSATLD